MSYGLSLTAFHGFRYDHVNGWKWWEVDEPRAKGNKRFKKFSQASPDEENPAPPPQPVYEPEPPVRTD
jgi:hypothetical protein